jgi:hypothetical protein
LAYLESWKWESQAGLREMRALMMPLTGLTGWVIAVFAMLLLDADGGLA